MIDPVMERRLNKLGRLPEEAKVRLFYDCCGDNEACVRKDVMKRCLRHHENFGCDPPLFRWRRLENSTVI